VIHGVKAQKAADADMTFVEELIIAPANVTDGRAGGEDLLVDPGHVCESSTDRGTLLFAECESKAELCVLSR
jgi:hypothetical protein